jgi:AcrR family transcriptional regulator
LTDGTRSYDNTGRQAKAALTRAAILEAFVAQLGQPGVSDVSVPEAAERVGVSVRTVYHHFPDREARVAGLAEWSEAVMGPVDHPLAVVDDIPGFIRAAYDRARRFEALTRALYTTGLGGEARNRRLQSRRRRYRQLLDTIGAPRSATRRAAAVISVLATSEAGMPLVDIHKLSFAEAGAAAAAAAEAIITSLREGAARRQWASSSSGRGFS